jgi:hypothetical protein
MVPILPCRSIDEPAHTATRLAESKQDPSAAARAQDLLGATDEFRRLRTSEVEEDR